MDGDMGNNWNTVDLLESKSLRHGISLSLCALSALLVWSMFPHRPKRPEAAVNPVTAPTRSSPHDSAERVATFHLFGRDATDSVASGPVATVATVNIQGLFYSTDPDLARVILDVAGTSDVFKTGDTLPDGERVKAIGMNAVQIANGVSLREVDLDRKFGNDSPGIQLSGIPELYAQQDSLPGAPSPAGSAAPVVQRLAPVMLPQTGDPLSQMRALRQQLIRPVNPKN